MKYFKVPAEDLRSLLLGMSEYIDMTKEASQGLDQDRLLEVVDSLCASGLVSMEKKSEIITGIKRNPNKIYDLLEKIASKAGPSSLGGSDSQYTDGQDAGRSFEEFCLR